MNTDEPMDERGQTAPSASGHVNGSERAPSWGPIDGDWDGAIAAARRGDPEALVAYVAARSGFRRDIVESFLLGEADEPVAILCRAASLPWETFEGVLSYRARRFGRGPGMFGNTIRLYRDTTVDTARRLVGGLSTGEH